MLCHINCKCREASCLVAEESISSRYYVLKDEIYGIIHELQINTGHGEQNWVYNEERKGMVFQFLMFGKMNSRGQAGAIDILSQADRDFNCILVYQYYLKS